MARLITSHPQQDKDLADRVSRTRQARLISGFATVVFFGFAIFALVQAFGEKGFASGAVKTTANVTSVASNEDDDCDSHRCRTAWDMTYGISYTADNQQFTATVIDTMANKGQDNPPSPTTLKVRYSKQDPSIVKLFSPTWEGFAFAAFMFAGAALFGAIFFWSMTTMQYSRWNKAPSAKLELASDLVQLLK